MSAFAARNTGRDEGVGNVGERRERQRARPLSWFPLLENPGQIRNSASTLERPESRDDFIAHPVDVEVEHRQETIAGWRVADFPERANGFETHFRIAILGTAISSSGIAVSARTIPMFGSRAGESCPPSCSSSPGVLYDGGVHRDVWFDNRLQVFVRPEVEKIPQLCEDGRGPGGAREVQAHQGLNRSIADVGLGVGRKLHEPGEIRAMSPISSSASST